MEEQKLATKWWESLGKEGCDSVERKHGYYGHDIGSDIFDVVSMWKLEGKPIVEQ